MCFLWIIFSTLKYFIVSWEWGWGGGSRIQSYERLQQTLFELGKRIVSW
jgi:hypothetical protein